MFVVTTSGASFSKKHNIAFKKMINLLNYIVSEINSTLLKDLKITVLTVVFSSPQHAPIRKYKPSNYRSKSTYFWPTGRAELKLPNLRTIIKQFYADLVILLFLMGSKDNIICFTNLAIHKLPSVLFRDCSLFMPWGGTKISVFQGVYSLYYSWNRQIEATFTYFLCFQTKPNQSPAGYFNSRLRVN